MSQQAKAWGAVLLASAAAGALLVLVVWVGRAPSAPAVGQALTRACPASLVPDGHDYHGLTLSMCNFSGQDLSNANFQGATLTAVLFIKTDLTGADFSNATIVDSQNPALPTDFSFSTLTNAKFIGATFDGTTYFTYANVTCADFSNTNINKLNAIFGDNLTITYDQGSTCRTAFRQTTMNCEFLDAWKALDLSSADISACQTQLQGRDFSNSFMNNVNFDSAVLDGVNFAGAELNQAVFDGASLQCLDATSDTPQCVDLSNAKLQGASLKSANLTGASLYNAFLSDNINGNISRAASLTGVHLKNVNLSFAQLSGVDFTLANFYGDNPGTPCATTGSDYTGFTTRCASAHAAQMTATRFDNAYLYGVDFSNATIAGVSFDQAVLSGANFAGATIASSPNSGAVTSFSRAFLQGTNLDKAMVTDADLSNAFVDFRDGGNLIYINLNGTDHNSFAGCPTGKYHDRHQARLRARCLCVVRYPATTVPETNTTITCPDTQPSGSNGCGAAVADPTSSNSRWASTLTIGTPPDPGPPPAWYSNNATYTSTPSDPDVICNGKGKNAGVILW